MEMIKKKTWEEKNNIKDLPFKKEMILNGLTYEKSDRATQRLYRVAEWLEERIKKLETEKI